MAKLNCWDVKKCGREPNGVKVEELGVCLASTEAMVDGINGGQKGGRACWALVGTLCGGAVQASFAKKVGSCLECEFYKQVEGEEGPTFIGSLE